MRAPGSFQQFLCLGVVAVAQFSKCLDKLPFCCVNATPLVGCLSLRCCGVRHALVRRCGRSARAAEIGASSSSPRQFPSKPIKQAHNRNPSCAVPIAHQNGISSGFECCMYQFAAF